MHRLIRCLGMLILSIVFIVPTINAQDKKADDPKPGDDKKDAKVDAKAKNKPKVDWGYTVDGKLIAVDANNEKEFTVQFYYKIPQPNPNAPQQIAQAQQQIAQAQMSMAQAKNAQQYNQAAQQYFNAQVSLQKAIAGSVTYKDATYDFKCKAMEHMRVRHVNVQVEFDDKSGEIKKMTKKELEDLRADGYPAYPAQFKALTVGQAVRIYFSKDTKLPAAYTAKDTKKVPVDDQQAVANQPVYWDVVQIVIVAEPPAPKGK
jgi:hypothetical protein